MTTLTPPLPASTCPVPPADLSNRPLPIKVLDLRALSLQRIHRSVHDPVYFNKPGVSGSRFRFDAPDDEFGVLYASQHFNACVAETIIRNRFVGKSLPLLLEETQLSSRSVSMLTTKSGQLRLADLTVSIVHLGGDGQILSDPNYGVPNLWSLAIEAHPDGVDGIYFTSRYAHEPSVAIFDRTPVEKVGTAVGLLHSPDMAAYLNKYKIALT